VLNFAYDEKYIEESINTEFLGLQINNHLNWKNHIDVTILKLSRVCYAIRSMSHISSTDTLKSNYFAYFHAITKYGCVGLIPQPRSPTKYPWIEKSIKEGQGPIRTVEAS
jgi:hypothetical protein